MRNVTLKVNVSQKLIDKARENLLRQAADGGIHLGTLWCKNCPVALAFKEAGLADFHVADKELVLHGDLLFTRVELPKPVRDLVRMADTHRNVILGMLKADEYDVDQEPLKPISFSVDIPEQFLNG